MLTNDRVYVDVHVLQTVPPSCVNRDDTEALKLPYTVVQSGQGYRLKAGKAMQTCSRISFPLKSGRPHQAHRKMVSDAISSKADPTPKKWLFKY